MVKKKGKAIHWKRVYVRPWNFYWHSWDWSSRHKFMERGYKIGGEVEEWTSMFPHPEFDKIMKLYWWKDFCHFLPFAFQNLNLKAKDDLRWKFHGTVEAFNNNRYDKIQISLWLIIDETMSAWRPRTTPTSGLPNISFILRKPEPLGKSLCCFACFNFSNVTNSYLFIYFEVLNLNQLLVTSPDAWCIWRRNAGRKAWKGSAWILRWGPLQVAQPGPWSPSLRLLAHKPITRGTPRVGLDLWPVPWSLLWEAMRLFCRFRVHFIVREKHPWALLPIMW